jgi:hypothetical protein
VSLLETAASRPQRRPAPGGARGDGRADAAVVAGLLLVALLAYGSYALRGGFYSDDWNFAADYEAESADGFFAGVANLLETSVSRPVGTVYAALRSELFGVDPTGHLVLAAALGLALAVLFYAVLRALGTQPLHAAPIALLTLLFPLADSTRLWATGSAANLAVCLYLAGVLLAFAALRHRGPAAVAMHAGSVALYAASVMTYEFTLVPVLLSVLLYWRSAPGRAAITRWAVDVVAMVAVLALATAQTTVPREPISALPERVAEVTAGALSVVSWSVFPVGGTSDLSVARLVGGLIVVAVLGAALARLRNGARAGELRPWLIVAAVATAVIAAGYLVLLPAAGYNPAHRGIANRVNGFSALGVAALVYALVMLAALQLGDRLRRPAAPIAVTLTALLVVGYAVRLQSDERDWRDAAGAQERVLARLAGTRPPPAGGGLAAFHVPDFTAPGVPVFHQSWDLTGALQLLWDDYSLQAYPVNNGRTAACAASDLEVTGGDETARLPYGRTRFFDGASGRSAPIRSRADCRAWVDTGRPREPRS